MVLPLKSWFTVWDGIILTTTARIPALGAEHPEHANSIILEIVGADTPSWTLDIQGRTIQAGTYTAVDYVQIWQAGAAPLANAQLSITDTTRRFYLIPNCPSFLQLIATRTTGNLTVRGCYTSEVFNQWLLTTARGSLFTEGPIAHDAVDAGNPIKMGAVAASPTNMPTAVGGGDIVELIAGTQGNLLVTLIGQAAQGAVLIQGMDNDGRAAANLALVNDSRQMLFNGTSWDRRRGVFETDNYIAASLVSATQNGADRMNYNSKGLTILVDVTARNGTSTITLALQSKDGNGNYGAIWTATAALSATGQARYHIYPTAENTEGWTEHANTSLGARIYRVVATYGGADTVSFDVDLVELPA